MMKLHYLKKKVKNEKEEKTESENKTIDEIRKATSSNEKLSNTLFIKIINRQKNFLNFT